MRPIFKDIYDTVFKAKLETDWVYPALINNPDLPVYWKGYFSRYLEEAGNSMSLDSQEFKDNLLDLLKNCWEEI